MSRFTDRLERDLDQIADRASPSSTAWKSILDRIDERADDPETEVIMLTPDENRPDTRNRTWLYIAATVVAVAVVGGLILAGTRSGEDPASAEPSEPTEPTPTEQGEDPQDTDDADAGTSIPLTGADGDPAAREAFAIVESAFAAYNSGDMDTWATQREAGAATGADFANDLARESRLDVERCDYRGLAEWDIDTPVTGHGFDCEVTQSDIFLQAAGVELEMIYNWVITEDLATSIGGSNENFVAAEAMMREYRKWLETTHPDVAANIQYNTGSFPLPEGVPIAAEYIDEFVAESSRYPPAYPVPPVGFGGPLEEAG